MATKGQKSPLTRLQNAIDRRLIGLTFGNGHGLWVSKRTLQRWRQWAEAPDGRFRLDGSARSKRKGKKR